MSNHESNSGDSSRYTLTIFLSFVVLFVFLMLMMLWQGNYKPNGGEKNNSTEVYR